MSLHTKIKDFLQGSADALEDHPYIQFESGLLWFRGNPPLEDQLDVVWDYCHMLMTVEQRGYVADLLFRTRIFIRGNKHTYTTSTPSQHFWFSHHGSICYMWGNGIP